MTSGLPDLLGCVAAFARSLEEAFDPQRFLDDFSVRAQPLVPHEGMRIAYLEDEGRTFSAFARHTSGRDVMLDFRNYTITFDPSVRFPRATAGFGPIFDGQSQMANDDSGAPGPTAPSSRSTARPCRKP